MGLQSPYDEFTLIAWLVSCLALVNLHLNEFYVSVGGGVFTEHVRNYPAI